MKKTRFALFQSAVALLLCISMLTGTTFAWFTDGVRTGINTIAAGVLDVELYHSNAAVTDERVDSATKLFMDLQGNPILWEPGAVSYENLRVANEGDLALAYQLAMRTANENHVVDPSGAQYGLSQVLKVGVVENGITATDRAGVVASVNAANWTTLAEFLQGGSLLPEGKGEFEKTWGIVIYWEPGENDNYWNLNNDKVLDQGEYLMIDLGISLIATQEEYESDSFGSDYDAEAKAFLFPDYVGGSASAPVVPDAENKTSAQVSMSDGHVSAVVPAGVLLETGVTELKLTVTPMNASGANIALGENEDLRALDVHVEGVSADNTVPMIIDLGEVMPVGLNMGNYKLYHVEDGANHAMTLVASEADFNAHNQFTYDPATGAVKLYMASFSEVAVVADTVNPWNGKRDYTWYNDKANSFNIANADELAGFGAIVGGMDGNKQDSFSGKTVCLIADINLGDKESENKTDLIFYPIGYYNSEGTYEKTNVAITSGLKAFEGDFDGQGHSISNFYQNTWEMKGDNNYYDATLQYYRDGMGLFGKVYGGTVKNLTVENFSSDGEYTTTGVIAAYADGATFKNIAIINCNPRVYNIGNGGIVGCVGWYAKEAKLKTTFKNITVDNSNKISALWGSYDVACGGIVGQYYPTSGQTSAGTPANGGIEFENCHIAAQMDVYNDVCGNYQYYAYRYAGMLIGSVRENVTIDGHVYPKMDGITAKDCTVHFGTWNDYYYCEFEENGHPSYSGPDDYKFSRVPNSEINTSKGKENATCIGHNHTKVEDNQAIYLPFNNLVTGYGWGVTTKVVGELDGVKILDREVADSVVKFETKFTGNFLYRVGNLNTVSVGSLFDVVKNDDGTDKYTINSSGVVVTVENYEKDAKVGGTFKANIDNWTQGTIQFSGTGLVKITIQDYNYCTPTELIVEVVDAKNITKAESATANNVVLLNNVENGSFSVSAPYGFYGNGFTITLNPDNHTTKRGAGFDGYIHMNGGTLDNIRIEGPTFAAANIYREQGQTGTGADDLVNYFRNGVIIDSGNAKITNSYLSGARTALYIKNGGNVVIKNTTVSGGAYANIEVSAANSVTLSNVTTIQKAAKDSYGQNKEMIGLAIVVDKTETKLILDGVTQYNWMTKDQWSNMLGSYESRFPKLFTDNTYSELWHKDAEGTRIVNTGIIWGCEFSEPNKIGEIQGYTTKKITLNDTDGVVYTVSNGGNSNTVIDGTSSAGPESNNQTAIPPVATFDYQTADNYKQYVDGESEYCYYDAGVVKIGFEVGQSKEWNPMILTVKKNDKSITNYNVTFNGVDYTDKSITFNEAGEYQVVYTFTDPYNYKYNEKNELVSYGVEYTETVSIVVSVTEASAKNAEFAFGASDSQKAAEKITINNQTWLSVTGVTASDLTESQSFANAPANVKHNYDKTSKKGWGSVTTNGQTIYFPIVPMLTTDDTFEHTGSWYGCFPVFEGVIEIKDYAEKGTAETPTVYNGSTTTMPEKLKALDPQNYFVYQGTVASVPKVPSKITKGGYNGKLCYTTQTDLTASNERGEVWTLATYTYEDNKGATYYWYVGYYCAASKNGGCVTGDTLITMADGSKKQIQYVTNEDQLLVWDFYTGAYAKVPASIIWNHGEANYDVTSLYFEDGTVVEMINTHGFYDVNCNNFVYLTTSNVSEYVGHSFVTVDGDSYTTVKLVDYSVENRFTGCYSLQTAVHNNFIVEDMFSMTTPDYEGWFDYFNINDDMKYDEEHMRQEIAKYGLTSYDSVSHLGSYDIYVALNARYLNILIGRGVVTMDEVIEMLQKVS